MERDLYTPPEKRPEDKWDFFEGLDKDDDKDDSKQKKSNTWLGANPKAESEEDKPKNKNSDKSKGGKKSVANTEEFARMTVDQKKTALAKEYIDNRSQELQEELEAAPEGSPEIAEISADLELIQALSNKLENPDVVAEDAVEEAYQQIMERLDEIFAEENEDNLLTDPEDETEDTDIDSESKDDKSKTKLHSSLFTPIRSSKKAKAASAPKNSLTPQIGGTQKPKDTDKKQSKIELTNNAPDDIEVAPITPRVARQRRTGKLAVSEAMNHMLSRRYEDESNRSDTGAQTHEDSSISELPTPTVSTERVVNPIKRTVEEKERHIRRLATKFTLGENLRDSVFEADSSVTNPDGQPPVRLETVRPIVYQEHSASPTQPERKVTPEQSRDLAQSSTEQLLQIADKIRVDGTTLRSLYADNKIDRAGLTKVIKEALKGGDVKRALSKATLGAEAQRGRKIEMRHDDQTFDDIKGYHNTTEAAKARTDRILQSLEMVNQAKNHDSSTVYPSSNLPIKDRAMQKADAASQKAHFAVVTVAVLTATAMLLLILFVF